jgi:hypothetical protein
MTTDCTGQSGEAGHRPIPPWLRAEGGQLIAGCCCGWRSLPCLNGEFANQAWECHAASAIEPQAKADGDVRDFRNVTSRIAIATTRHDHRTPARGRSRPPGSDCAPQD